MSPGRMGHRLDGTRCMEDGRQGCVMQFAEVPP
jgi:hypothetical protein